LQMACFFLDICPGGKSQKLAKYVTCTVPIVAIHGGKSQKLAIRHMYCSYRSTIQRSSTARRRAFSLRARSIISSINHGGITSVAREMEFFRVDFGRNTWHGIR